VIVNALVGQQQVWIGAGLAISLWLLIVRGSPVQSAIVQGFTLCVTKILVALFWPILFAVSRPRVRWLVTALAIPLLTVEIFLCLGSDLSVGLRLEQQDYTSGNLIYYINYLVRGGTEYFPLYDSFTALCLMGVSVFLFVWLRDHKHDDIGLVLSAVSLLLVVLLLVSKKSYAGYLGFAYFAILFVLYKDLPRFWFWCTFSLFSVAATVSPTIWFASQGSNKSLRDWLTQSGWFATLSTVIVDWILIALYATTTYICLKTVADRGTRSRLPRN
jgi:hypothetical protein